MDNFSCRELINKLNCSVYRFYHYYVIVFVILKRGCRCDQTSTWNQSDSFILLEPECDITSIGPHKISCNCLRYKLMPLTRFKSKVMLKHSR